MAICLTLVAGVLLSAAPAAAAEPAPGGDPLARKSQEVERLQQELQKAKADLDRLQQENRQLRTAGPTNPPAPPAPKLDELAPLQDSEVVPATELAEHFQADPAAAARRYEGKLLRISGEIEGFDRPLVERVYAVKLVVPNRHPGVVAKFNYMDRYRTVFTRDNGRTLAGRIDERAVRTLHRVGEPAVLQGRCKGLVDSAVVLTGCTRLK